MPVKCSVQCIAQKSLINDSQASFYEYNVFVWKRKLSEIKCEAPDLQQAFLKCYIPSFSGRGSSRPLFDSYLTLHCRSTQKVPGTCEVFPSSPSLNYIWLSLLGTLNRHKLVCGSAALISSWYLMSSFVFHLYPQLPEKFFSLITHVGLLHSWAQLSPNFTELRVLFIQ